MATQNGQKFSAYNKDVDVHRGNCAQLFKGGWWYAKCHSSNEASYEMSATSQGQLLRVCLETTVRYDCICKTKVNDSIKHNIHLGLRLQYILKITSTETTN
jgi:hypothetical protein